MPYLIPVLVFVQTTPLFLADVGAISLAGANGELVETTLGIYFTQIFHKIIANLKQTHF